MIKIPFPVPSGVTTGFCTCDAAGAAPYAIVCAALIKRPAERSCLHSSDSKEGRYFRVLVLRRNMELPLGVCPVGARTVPHFLMEQGWIRARSWAAAARVLSNPGRTATDSKSRRL